MLPARERSSYPLFRLEPSALAARLVYVSACVYGLDGLRVHAEHVADDATAWDIVVTPRADPRAERVKF